MTEVAAILDAIKAEKESRGQNEVLQPVVETDRCRWHLRISQFETLGLLLEHLEVSTKQPSSLPLDKRIQLLEGSITYLEEDFRLVEHDQDAGQAVLRSQIPLKAENTVSYYEVVLKVAGGLQFNRYEFDKSSGARKRRSANLSRETFERLVADFAKILV